MKILYISPENTVGTLTLWKKEHERMGNICRTITFFKSPKNFEDDICLNLPFNFTNPGLARIRNFIYKRYRGEEGYFKPKKGFPPKWAPEGVLDSLFFKFKDWLWYPTVKKTINKFNLYDFDVVHFESGTDFLKNEFFVKKLRSKNKKIICHYHGEDLRTRGVMPIIDDFSNLNLTNEVDLLDKHPHIQYLFLPYNTSSFPKRNLSKEILRISHAPTNRFYKGSDYIIKICKKLENKKLIKFDLIENVTHEESIKRKSNCDIFIDQIGDRGGWGYGMNSVESLSMGICTLTQINKKYQNFIPDNPFININKKNLKRVLEDLIKNRKKLSLISEKSKKWVKEKHDIKMVSKKLYEYYKSIGLSF